MAKGIYKRGKTYWIRYAGSDGRIIYESTKSTKFKVAEILLLKRKETVAEGLKPEIKKIPNYSFKQLIEKYLDWMEGRQRSASTKRYRIRGSDKNTKDSLSIEGAFGNLPLKDFNTQIVEQYQTELIKKGLKPASINKNIGIVKHMFKKAVDWDMVSEEVLKKIRKVEHFKEDNGRLRYLTIDECHNLIDSCDPELKSIVITALHTGARKGKILGLKWQKVDLRHGFISLDKTKNGEGREIPIDETLEETLKAIVRRLDVPYVFYNSQTEKPYTDIRKPFQKALKKANIKDFTFHDLRHTFASHLVMGGTDLATVRDLLGHKTLTMTLRYAHLAPSHKEKAIKKLDSIFGRKKPTIQKLYKKAGKKC